MPRTEYLSIRIDSELKEVIKAAAEADGRTISNYVLHLIKKDLERKEK